MLGVDISSGALEVAALNAKRLGVADRVRFAETDALSLSDFGEKFDIIVSNPPYIPDKVVDTLDADVKDYEPRIALCGGDDGLRFYRAITAAASNMLTHSGLIMFEVGFDQADAVAEIMKKDFRNIGCIKDLSGIKRIVYGLGENK